MSGPAFVHSRKATLTPGAAGITAGTGTVYKSSVHKQGDIIVTRIIMDITGLSSSAAADIIGVEAAADCHIGQINTAVNGTIAAVRMTCLETPLTGEPDIDLYSADESTGTEDTAVTALTTDTAVINAAIDWTTGTSLGNVLIPADTQFLYLVGSGAGTDAVYTAGRFLIELYGHGN